MVKDLPPDQIPDGGWQDGKNVRLFNGRAMALDGYQRFFASALQAGASQRIMHGDQLILEDGSDFLTVFTLTKSYKWNTVTLAFDDISGGFSFTGGADNYFFTDVGFNLLLIANGLDVAKKWSGSGNIATLGGLSTAAPLGGGVIPSILRPFQGFTIALNNIEDGGIVPFRVRWGRIGQVEVWSNASDGSGQAGWNDLNDTPRGIGNALQLGNFLAIYKSDGVYLMSYVGPPAVFDFRKVVTGRGLLAARALVSMGSVHYFLSDDDFYAFDGAQISPIGGRMKDFFFKDVHQTYKGRTMAILMKPFGEVWWFYPSSSSNGDFDTVLIYSYRTGAWSFGDFAATCAFLYTLQSDYSWVNQPDLAWSDVPGPWEYFQFAADAPIVLFGDGGGLVYKQGLVYSQDGAAYVKSITSKLYDFKKPGVYKRLQRVQLNVDQLAKTNLKVYVGTANNPDDAVTWNGPFTIQTNQGQPKIDCDLTAIYFTFKFESVGVNDPWEVRGLTPWFIERGLY